VVGSPAEAHEETVSSGNSVGIEEMVPSMEKDSLSEIMIA